MKIFAFSDWRIQSIDMLNDLIEEIKPDAILYAGDDLRRIVPLSNELYFVTKNHFLKFNKYTIKNEPLFNTSKSVRDFVSELLTETKYYQRPREGVKLKNIPFYYVNGNDEGISLINNKWYLKISDLSIFTSVKDNWNVPKYFTETSKKRIKSTFDFNDCDPNDGIYMRLNINPSFGLHMLNHSFTFFGIECSAGLQSDIKDAPNSYADIYLSHVPPKGILDLSVRFGKDHIGSTKLRESLEQFNPKYVICGHSHFWGGRATKYNDTTIINVSSADKAGSAGNYVIVDTNNDQYEIGNSKVKTLSQIRGGELKIYERSKLFDEDILKTYDNNNLLKGDNNKILKSLEAGNRQRLADRIRSLKWTTPKVIKKINLDPYKYAYVDVETGLMDGNKAGKLWLIGLLYNNKVKQFEFPNERKLFVEFLKNNCIKELVSWSPYDRLVLSSLKECENIKWVDACQRTSNSVTWHTYELNELHNAFFNSNKSLTIPAREAGIYADHLILNKDKCLFCPPREELVLQIKKRNENDLIKMYKICKYLWNYNVIK